ncbi:MULTISPECIES: ABC transporter permease [Dehalococcoides]|uniref:Uncharacterized protein n=1 Tax=Dehalococcoides mccartyi TaxID=61435 RepID=A0A1S7AVM6_9CHLR|nr:MULTISPECIES: ABC transporter permease [Dehalococcoides]AGG07093.1 BerB-like protein [Dehalococcoides mccartyi DCMB5]AQU06548.1 ABC transporter permease [Dehalococcoides mccartyi]AQU07988.1 ABC transporter permease [Dehalococcoides mccartyi]AQW63010.1 ABC transporter permease [Dehalococcoides mccartyi]AQX73915.1 ABC transporter permease [Dehalococcoides mccartyi]
MNGLKVLFKKELREQLKTYKMLIVGIAFVFFGISTPLLLAYLPQIIEFSGQGADMPINMPDPTPLMSMQEFGQTMLQVGVLICILITMGTISGEKEKGTAMLTLSKPVSRGAFVMSKYLALGMLVFVSMLLSAGLCYAYTLMLIGDFAFIPFLGSTLLLTLFLLLCLAVTLFFSSFFKSSLAAGGTALVLLIAQGLATQLPWIGKYLPGNLSSWSTQLLSGSGEPAWGALVVAVVIIGLCLYFARIRLEQKEL